MGKIIIQNNTTIPDVETLKYIQAVMELGRISNNDKQYCYATSFDNGKVVVFSDLNSKSDKFTIINGQES